MYSRLDIPESPTKPFTDYDNWRLRVSDLGRHTWHYLKTEEERREWPQTICDKFWLGKQVVGDLVHASNLSTLTYSSRIYQFYHPRQRPWKQRRMAIPSTKTYNPMMATGQEHTVAPCFSFQAMSLVHM